MRHDSAHANFSPRNEFLIALRFFHLANLKLYNGAWRCGEKASAQTSVFTGKPEDRFAFRILGLGITRDEVWRETVQLGLSFNVTAGKQPRILLKQSGISDINHIALGLPPGSGIFLLR